MTTSRQTPTDDPTTAAPRGPRYTITGDFHYCVIEAESSDRGSCTIAVATATSPGAQPGEDWRARFRADLWLVPEATDPYAFAVALYRNWYDEAGDCPRCGDDHCAAFSECAGDADADRPYQPATPEGRAQEWRRLAREWARLRWCWDEALDDDRAEGAYEAGERPDAHVDALADKYDLTDPTEGWGVLDTPTERMAREHLRAVITAFEAEPQAATVEAQRQAWAEAGMEGACPRCGQLSGFHDDDGSCEDEQDEADDDEA